MRRLHSAKSPLNFVQAAMRSRQSDSHKMHYGNSVSGSADQDSWNFSQNRSSKRTPYPEPQLWLISVAGDAIAVPAMSKCAQSVPELTNRCKNCAAVIEPASRPPIFFMSASLESIVLLYFLESGRRQAVSPVSRPASVICDARASSF